MDEPAQEQKPAPEPAPQPKELTKEQKALIAALEMPDRPLCLECLKTSRAEPQHLCVKNGPAQQCDSCKQKNVYCLNLNNGQSRTLLSMVRTMGAEMAKSTLRGKQVSQNTQEVYQKLVDSAIEFANTLNDLKNARLESDKLAGLSGSWIRLLQDVNNLKTAKDVEQLSARAGWEAAEVTKQLRRVRPQQPLNSVKELLGELTREKKRRADADAKYTRLGQDFARLRAKAEELEAARAAATKSRDKLAEELKNSRASVLVAETALQRISMERASRRELGRIEEAMGKLEPEPSNDAGNDVAASSSAVDDGADGSVKKPRYQWKQLPDAVKRKIFDLTLRDNTPSVLESFRRRHYELQNAAAFGEDMVTDPMEVPEAATAAMMRRLGHRIDFANEYSLNGYISANACYVTLNNFPYAPTREDYFALMNMCLVSKEWMVYTIHAQAVSYFQIRSEVGVLFEDHQKISFRPANRGPHYTHVKTPYAESSRAAEKRAAIPYAESSRAAEKRADIASQESGRSAQKRPRHNESGRPVQKRPRNNDKCA